MKKPVIGVLVGTVVYFLWGMISWTVLPWHNAVIKQLPEEQLISDTLKTVITDPGFYFFPGHGNKDEQQWMERYKKGPVGVVMFTPGENSGPMSSRMFVGSFIIDLITAAITMLILCLARDRARGIVPRALLVMLVGVAVGVAGHLPAWNWFHFPTDYTRVEVLDAIVGFLVLGFSQAMFVPKD